MLEPFEDLRRGESLDARGGQLEGQRQIVEATADLGDSLVGLEVGLHGSRPGKEEADPFLVNERRHRVLLLTGYMQRLPARDEEVEVRAGGKQLRNVGCCLHDLLEVVEEAEHLLVLDVVGQAVLRADDLRCRGEDERWGRGGEQAGSTRRRPHSYPRRDRRPVRRVASCPSPRAR